MDNYQILLFGTYFRVIFTHISHFDLYPHCNKRGVLPSYDFRNYLAFAQKVVTFLVSKYYCLFFKNGVEI